MKVIGQLYSPAALHWRKGPLYPLDRRLAEPQGWYGQSGEKKNLLPLLGTEIRWTIPVPCVLSFVVLIFSSSKLIAVQCRSSNSLRRTKPFQKEQQTTQILNWSKKWRNWTRFWRRPSLVTLHLSAGTSDSVCLRCFNFKRVAEWKRSHSNQLFAKTLHFLFWRHTNASR
jgi:hypothetical protein